MTSVERTPRSTSERLRMDRPEVNIWRSVAVGAAALALALGALAILWFLAMPLAIFFLAIVIAQALAPLVTRLERRLPRLGAILLIYTVLLLLLLGLVLVAVPPLVAQTQAALHDLPRLLDQLGKLVDRLAPGEGTRLVRALEPRIPEVVNSVLTPPMSALAGLVVFAQIMFLSIYWLIAMPGLHRFVLSLFPRERHDSINSVLGEIGQALGGYVRSAVIDAAIVGVITYVGLLILGVKFPIILALIAMLGEFIPLIGPTIAEIPAAALALLNSPLKAIIVLAFYLILQQIDGNIILPLIVRSQVKISPLLVTFAVFVGAWVGGIVGALIAIPLIASLKVIVVRIVAPAIRRWSGAERRVNVDPG